MIDDRKIIAMAFIDHLFYPWPEILAPVFRIKKHRLLVSHITPNHKSIEESFSRFYLCLCTVEIKLADPVDHCAKPLRVHSYPEEEIFLTNQSCKTFRTFNYASVNWKFGIQFLYGINPGWRVSFKAIADSGNLVIAR